jgi:16S rRNA (guanine(527)-N(7))-methyltransferase RsmG
MFHVKLQAGEWPGLPEPERERLEAFSDLLRAQANRLGLVSPGDVRFLEERHVLDSLRAAGCLTDLQVRRAVDVGSGAGLPGIPLAIVLPEVDVILLEPKRRRVAFLELVIERLGLRNASVLAATVEEAAASGLRTACALARAFAAPFETWSAIRPILEPEGGLVYFAGRSSWTDSEVRSLAREGVGCEICIPGRLAWQGPIVMIGGPTSPTPFQGPPTDSTGRELT